MKTRIDIMVFGATGFTGKHVIPYLHKLCPIYGGLSWGISGRSESKLKQVLLETAELLDVDSLNSIPIIIADVENEDSIMEMTKSAKTVINCCGPYRLYGEVVVKCCIKTGTNYVDVTAEPYFEELIEMKYHEEARKNGVYIVNSCGFSSISSELPLTFLENEFEGTINSVEFFMKVYNLSNDNGPVINYGTWKSAIHAISQLKSLITLKWKRNLKSLPQMKPKYKSRFPFTTVNSMGFPENRTVLYPTPDYLVMKRSQRYFYENTGKRPVQFQLYYLMGSWINIFLMASIGICVIILAQFQYGKRMLLKYPQFFGARVFSLGTPNEGLVKKSKVDLYFYAKGWKNSVTREFEKILPNKSVLGRLQIDNPGYGFTCLAVALSAILIVTEPTKLPDKGGVYTPAVAFNKTSFVKAFQENGVPLEIVSVKDL